MSNFERIFSERKDHKNFDLKIWSEIYNLRRPFAYIPDIKLRQRLADIEKNIQYLDESKMWDDAQEAEYGWQSPWWWFRAYQFTLWECERRGIKPDSPLEIRRQTRYHYDYARKRKLTAIRVARLEWLADLLDGKVRFGAAASYNDPRLQLAQQDNEISRDMFLPNSSITLKTERETKSSFASPIRLSASRSISVDGFTKDLPYWLLCFSTELDSRLLDEFSGGQSNVYGYFVLFDIEKFHRRLSEAIHSIEINCGRVNVEYYDEHLPPMDLTSVIGNKPFRFAYQRELRFFICGEESKIHSMPQLCLRAAIMSDIAGVYNPTGEKEAGFGPIRLFPKSY